MNYTLLGGGQVSGDTSVDIVVDLRNQSFNPASTLQEFMDQTADACKLQNGAIISSASPTEFVIDMVENGFLIKC